MSVKQRINDYFLNKVAKSKVNYLFAVSKEYLFTQIYELNEKIRELEAGKETLTKENNALKTNREPRIEGKYKLAYERLAQKYTELQSENKSIKSSVDTVSHIVENVSKQNEVLKERLKRTETENTRLVMENKKYKEKEKVIEIKKSVNHNFSKKVNNNNSRSMSLSK